MKKVLIPAVMVLALAGCASTGGSKGGQQTAGQQQPAQPTAPAIQVAQVDGIDRSVEVHYKCTSANGEQKMSAMYGVKDDTLVVAQVKVNDQASPGMWRVLNDANGETQNSYYAEGITWITDKATPANVARTNARVLLQAQSLDANGTPVGEHNVLLRDCNVERQAAAPARRNQQNRRNNQPRRN